MGKEQDVGGGRPHVSPWGIPRLPHIIDIPCCYSSAAPSCALSTGPPLSSRHAVYPPLSSSSFFSPLSPNIIDLYYRHTALRRSFRSAHQHRISTGVCPPRGRTIPFPSRWALNTREHLVNEWKTRFSAPFLVRLRILEFSLFPRRRSKRARPRLLRVPLSRRDRYLSLSRIPRAATTLLQYRRFFLLTPLFLLPAIHSLRRRPLC